MSLFKRLKRMLWRIEVEHPRTKNKYEVPLDVRVGGSFVSWLVTLPSKSIDNIYQPPIEGRYHEAAWAVQETSDVILIQFFAIWFYKEFYDKFKVTGDEFENIALRQLTVPKKLATRENVKRLVAIFKSALRKAREMMSWEDKK